MAYEDQGFNTNALGDISSFINQQNDYQGETEEERRQRLEREAARTQGPVAPAPEDVVHKQEIVTRADGSQTHKTTSEVPAPQQREPGFVERALNYVIPSAQAGELPGQQATPPVAQSFPLPAPPPIQSFPLPAPAPAQFKDLSNSGGPNVAYQPPQPEQPVVAGPQATEAGAGRGFVNPPAIIPVNPKVTPGTPAYNNSNPNNSGQAALVNNNPGNIMFGPYAQKMGATGAMSNGTAIFPDSSAGETAQDRLLSSPGYANLSIKDIPQRWAPKGHGNNDPDAYGTSLQKLTGFDNNTMAKKYNELTPAEQAVYRQSMAKIEHGTASSGMLPTPGVAAFQKEVVARDPGSLGTFGPNRDGVDGNMGHLTQAAIAANPDLAQKYGLAASGGRVEATQTPAQLGINAYQAAQQDPMALLKLSRDDNMPEFIRKRSNEQAYELMHQERIQQDVQATIQQQIQSGDTKGIAKGLIQQPKTEKEAAWKAAMYNLMGLKDAAKEVMKQAGYGNVWKPAMNAAGDTGLVKYSYNGEPIAGTKSNGQPMDEKDLAAYSSMGGSKATDVSGSQKQAVINGELHTFSTKRTPNGTMYRDDTAGGQWTMTAPLGMTHLGQQDPAHLKGLTAANSVSTKMMKDNQGASQATGKPIWTDAQIAQARNEAYKGITGKDLGVGGGFTRADNAGNPASTATIAPPSATAPTNSVPAPVTNAPAAPPVTAGNPAVNAPAGRAPKSLAQQILDGEAPPPAGPTSSTKVAILNEVNRLAAEQGKTYDSSRFKQHQETEREFNIGTAGKSIQSLNVAIDHMDTLRNQIQKLPNGQYPAVNDIISRYGRAIGDPRYNSYDAAAGLIAAEVTKAIVANGGTGDERAEKERLLAVQNNPAALRGVLNSYTQLLGGQMHGLEQRYKAGFGSNWESKVNERTLQAMGESKIQRPWNDQDRQAAQWIKANPNDPRAANVRKRLGL